MSSLRVDPVYSVASSNVGQCACGQESKFSKQNHVGHRTVRMGRMERTALWSLVSLGSFVIVSCLVMVVITRNKLDAIAETCSSAHNVKHAPQEITSTDKEKVVEDEISTSEDNQKAVKRQLKKKRTRTVRTQTDQVSTRASHFVADSDGSFDFQQLDVSCIPRWDGTFCRNGTYWSNKTGQIIKFFVGADWMKNNDYGIQPALVQSSPGMFTVQTGGLHLIYINVIIRTTEDKHDIEVYSDHTRLLRCRQGLDYVRQTNDRYLFSKTRTCSVMGLFYLEDGAVVTLRVLQARTTLSLGPDSTNFGAIVYTTHPQLDAINDISYFG
ncbi:uncharacterized protein LOC132545846 [Ylistrum balloti]|uniref:uncharacterized protein LOC132545846 n=1 Tax=Ylistrum balloti TaxID=509963 RepID=UPI00290595ED|nr:uncharacterized protein LOC132545846 [Ylistrum balloti]